MELTWVFALFASCLEKHADDGHHGESAVRELSGPKPSLESLSNETPIIPKARHLSTLVSMPR